MRWIFPLGAAAGLLGCPGNGSQPVKPDPKPTEIVETKLELPSVPAKIEVTKSQPTDGNAPDKRSAVLDIMKSENEREFAALRKQKDPAHYLAYQLVEQRVVNLEAEGGALVTDSDDNFRNLDVEVRVGDPNLDNTRDRASDDNGLNSPLTRRGVVPFGDDKQAISNALWLETDRRYREAVTALGYVRQDQATLKNHSTAPDFAPDKPEVYVEAPASLTFDKAQWVDRLKRCSAKALKGSATRGTCGVVFQRFSSPIRRLINRPSYWVLTWALAPLGESTRMFE